jgi:hypothetical protein
MRYSKKIWKGDSDMKTTFAMVFVMAASLSVNCPGQPSAAELCVKDLEVIPGFLLANDSGAKDHLAQSGQKHFDDALAEARNGALKVKDAEGCEVVVRDYLKAWRKGHLGVQTIGAATGEPAPTAEQITARHRKNAPTLQVLSPKTIVLTLKNFEDYNREPLIELLKDTHRELARHPNWIIDVRTNGGGSDSSYEPLLAWLLPDEVATVGVELLVTPPNIDGWARFCGILSPGDTVCEKAMSDSLARMRKAPMGQYVAQDDSGAVDLDRVKPLEPRRPPRVAILIDHGCGSSCEEFVMVARQSFQVKLIGRPTFGSLDYSNLRPFELPSGQRRLWYATSRSKRIPGHPVDLAGVPPDIYLPRETGEQAAQEEVRRVQSWLEGGSLAPPRKPAENRKLDVN